MVQFQSFIKKIDGFLPCLPLIGIDPLGEYPAKAFLFFLDFFRFADQFIHFHVL